MIKETERVEPSTTELQGCGLARVVGNGSASIVMDMEEAECMEPSTTPAVPAPSLIAMDASYLAGLKSATPRHLQGSADLPLPHFIAPVRTESLRRRCTCWAGSF